MSRRAGVDASLELSPSPTAQHDRLDVQLIALRPLSGKPGAFGDGTVVQL
jgi:hypothetical protein